MREMLLAMDPPQHVEYRRPLAELQGQVIAGLEPRSAPSAGRSTPRRENPVEVDFVHDVATLLPSQVVG